MGTDEILHLAHVLTTSAEVARDVAAICPEKREELERLAEQTDVIARELRRLINPQLGL